MTFEDLQNALAEFDLAGRASWREIRQRHRSLVRRYHPDQDGGDEEKIRRINAAYETLCDYVQGYRFDFSHQEFLQQNPEERLREQFYGAPPWGENL